MPETATENSAKTKRSIFKRVLPNRLPTLAEIKTFVYVYRLPILSGLLIGTSYIPFQPVTLFVCLTPLFVFWVQNTDAKKAFIGGWITQAILNLIGFHWIAYTAVEFGHFPWWAGLLVLFGFAAIAHLYFPIAGWAVTLIRNRFGYSAGVVFILLPLAFALCERLYPTIFPWHLGYPWLWAKWPGAQLADVIGFEGLNLFTIVINAMVAWAVLEGLFRFRRYQQKAWLILFLCVGLVGAVNFAGIGRDQKWSKTDAEVKVLAIQGNIGNFEKFMAEEATDFRVPILQKYLSLSTKALAENPDSNLILWPETAFPAYLDREYLHQGLQQSIRQQLRASNIPLLAGAYSRDVRTKKTFNGLFYLDAQGEPTAAPYRKSILLVFGETFPFSDVIPYMDWLFPDQGGFDRGQGPMAMPLHLNGTNSTDVLMGPQICYEGLYPWFSAGLAKEGAEIFVNVTNDSWFGKTFEPHQHLYMTLARAIEFRRPLLRGTNTGITTTILATGEILEKSPMGVEWTHQFKIPYIKNPPHTFYERVAPYWPWVLTILMVFALALGRVYDVKSRRGK